MEETKNSKVKYLLIILSILLAASLFFAVVGFACKEINSHIEDYYFKASLEADSAFVFPATVGNGMGLDYVHTIMDRYKSYGAGSNERWIVIFGASTSILGVDDNLCDNMIKACGGSASINTYYVLKNFLMSEGFIPRKDDVVKIDVSPVLFKKAALSSDVTVSALEYAGIYNVKDDFSVEKGFGFRVRKILGLGARELGKSLEYAKEYIKNESLDALFIPAKNSYERYDKLLSFDEERIRQLEDFIKSFDCNVIVDFLYESSELASSKAGEIFNSYIENRLKPFLDANNISYIDSRFSLDDDKYIDNTHLNKAGRDEYTSIIEFALDVFFK